MRALIVSLAMLAGCDGQRLAMVGKARLPEADGAGEVPAGETLVLFDADAPLPELPGGAKVVRIAADMDYPFDGVRELVLAAQAAGMRPVLLVTRSRRARALPATVAAIDESVLLEVYADGKSCISPPEAEERLCAQHSSRRHVDRAATRSLVRDAVKAYGLLHVHVRLGSGMSYADAVRALDAARTCCREAVEVSIDGLLLE